MSSMKLVFSLLASLTMASALGHIGTERYIPIGQSPGVSGKTSYIGQIESADVATRTMTMSSDKGTYRVRMNDETRIYVDRSSQRKTNLRGGYEDCQPGRRIEVKFRNNDPDQPAEWVKVDAGT